MPESPRIVQHYARLLDLRDAAIAAGQHPHPDVTRGISHIEKQASATLTQAQQDDAMRHVNMIRLQAAEQSQQFRQQGEAVQQQRALASELRDTTRNMSIGDGKGLPSVADIPKVARGEKITVKTGVERYDQDAADADMQKKHGVSMMGRLDQLEHCAHAMDADPARGARLMKTYGVSDANLDNYREHGLAFGMQVRDAQSRVDEPEEVEIQPSQQDEIRAALLQSVADASDDDDYMGEDPSPYADRDDMHGDIARACDAVELAATEDDLTEAL